MSYKYVDMALDIVEFSDDPVVKNLSAREHLTLVTLARYSDDKGRNCFPGLALLSKKLHCSERQVQRDVSALESAKLLEKSEKRTRSKSTVYRLTFPDRLIALHDIKHKRRTTSIEHASKIVKNHIDQLKSETTIEVPKELQG